MQFHKSRSNHRSLAVSGVKISINRCMTNAPKLPASLLRQASRQGGGGGEEEEERGREGGGGGELASRQGSSLCMGAGRWVIEGLTRAPALVRLSYDNHLFPPDNRKGPSIILLTAE